MFDLSTFSLDDMIRCSAWLRAIGRGSHSIEETATRIVRALHEDLAAPSTDDRCCALVRLFAMSRFDELSPVRQRFAARMAGQEALAKETMCFELLASAGDQHAWNEPERSEGHLAIPFPNEKALAQMPMLAELCKQLGMDVRSVVRPNADTFVDPSEETYDVFHVEHAAESPYVPAKAGFVDRFGIRSVLGFGGMLPSARMFAVLLFSKVHVKPEVARLFRPLSLAVKLALLPDPRIEDRVSRRPLREEVEPCTT